MNKKLLKFSMFAFGAFFASARADHDDITSFNGDQLNKTFLTVRPNFQVGMPEVETFWRRKAKTGCCGENYAECAWGGAIQIVGFGGASTNSSHLGRHFMFGGTNTLTVNTNNKAQINPIHFGVSLVVTPGEIPVLGNFSGTITFNPRQKFAGVGFEWRNYFDWWNCDCDDQRWWFDISFPFETVRNTMRLTETIISTTGTPVVGAVATMTEGFAGLATFGGSGSPSINPSGTTPRPMQFGLIPLNSDCHSLRHNGVADVTLRLGWDAYCCDTCYVNAYIGGLAPTGNRPHARFVFEPIVGHNHHAGVVFGGLLSYDVWGCEDRALSVEVNIDSLYLFKGRETRSFDLKSHGAWSRYMLVYATPADAALGIVSPGINFFTQEFDVTPRFWTSVNTALVYNSMCGFEGEIGWNFWARQGEKVALKSPFPVGVSIADFAPNNTRVLSTTNLLSTIGNNNSCNGGTDCTNTAPITVGSLDNTLTVDDIDFLFRNLPVQSNTIYGAFGYNFDWCWLPMWVGVGGSYEFGAINSTLSRWAAWGKWGMSF